MLIDTHCHLYDEAFRPDFPEVLERAREAGVGRWGSSWLLGQVPVSDFPKLRLCGERT